MNGLVKLLCAAAGGTVAVGSVCLMAKGTRRRSSPPELEQPEQPEGDAVAGVAEGRDWQTALDEDAVVIVHARCLDSLLRGGSPVRTSSPRSTVMRPGVRLDRLVTEDDED